MNKGIDPSVQIDPPSLEVKTTLDGHGYYWEIWHNEQCLARGTQRFPTASIAEAAAHKMLKESYRAPIFTVEK